MKIIVYASTVLCLVTQSCLTLCNPMDYNPSGSSVHGDSSGKNIGVGCHAFLQRIFPTWGLNLGLPHCRWILYHLSHQGSPRILAWVAYPFSSESSWPRNWTRVSWIAGGFFTSWATKEALILCIKSLVLIYLITGSLYPSSLLTSGNCKSDLLFYELFVFEV